MAFVVNSPETSFQLSLEGAVVQSVPPTLSPIDTFYTQRTLALSLGSAGALAVSDQLRPLALVPLFSAAEMYFRRILARAISVCPICAEQAGTQQISLGSISVLDRYERAFAIAEHMGFTSEGEITRRTQKVLDIDLNKSASLKAAIQEFEALCHLRHSIVHCSGELMYLNRRTLELRVPGRLLVALPIKEFQDVVAKVSNVVRAYNSHVALELLKRWIKTGVLCKKWGGDRRKVIKLVDSFWSVTDLGAIPNYRLLYDHVKSVA